MLQRIYYERRRCYIAWIGNGANGRWIDGKERRELIDVYADYVAMLDERYPDIANMSADVMADYLEKSKELARLQRIERCEADTLEFAIEYFSEARNPGNDGNWDGFDVADKSESPEFHREITDIMNVVSNERVNANIAVAAPRSHAKSSYLSKDLPIHQVVYRLRKYEIGRASCRERTSITVRCGSFTKKIENN